ncbi:MAG TPA: hypothetical protein VLG74_02470, partial [Blastocatellia bacterium]|nr:hypothetical protein [Blastocatellia bacterium]
ISTSVMLCISPARLDVQDQTPTQQQPPPAQPKEEVDVPISIEAPVEPILVKADDGRLYVNYHLFLCRKRENAKLG